MHEHWVFTASQRRVVAGVLVIAMALIAWRAVRDGGHISNPPPDNPSRQHRLADRIDPNTADLPSLAALPGVGEARARAIVEYRATRAARGNSTPAFRQIEDLLRVPGIGASMIDQLRPHLLLPATPPPENP